MFGACVLIGDVLVYTEDHYVKYTRCKCWLKRAEAEKFSVLGGGVTNIYIRNEGKC
jgi:hypothetical protein